MYKHLSLPFLFPPGVVVIFDGTPGDYGGTSNVNEASNGAPVREIRC